MLRLPLLALVLHPAGGVPRASMTRVVRIPTAPCYRFRDNGSKNILNLVPFSRQCSPTVSVARAHAASASASARSASCEVGTAGVNDQGRADTDCAVLKISGQWLKKDPQFGPLVSAARVHAATASASARSASCVGDAPPRTDLNRLTIVNFT